MSFLEKLDKYKNKKQLSEELEYYKTQISKNYESKEFKTALEKINSAITLIKEYEEDFNLEKDKSDFFSLRNQIETNLNEFQQYYQYKYNNLLKENLTETNLENFSKLLAILKEDIDENIEEFVLKELSDKINQYFKYLNRVYVVAHTYKLLNYSSACQKILELVKEIKDFDYPNLKALIFTFFQNLLVKQFCGFSKECDKLSLHELSDLLSLDSSKLRHFIDIIVKSPDSPIQQFNPETLEIIFRK